MEISREIHQGKGVRKREFQYFFPAVICSLALSFMLFVYEPLVIYFTNKDEFWFDAFLLMPICLLMFAAAGIFSIAVLGMIYLFHDKLYKISIVLYAIAFLCTYIQGNFLAGNLPPLDGSPVYWNLYDYQRRYTIILWIVVTLLVLAAVKIVRMDRFVKGVGYISAGFILMFFITLSTICATHDGLEEKIDVVLSLNHEFDLSTDKNFIILLLDTVDGTKMNQLLESSPKDREALSDFTWYENTMGGYPLTNLAIPHILSGEWYECEDFLHVYSQNAYNNSKLFQKLQEDGYRMGLYTEVAPLTDKSIYRFENAVPDLGRFSSVIAFMKVEMRLVGLKYMPYDFKKRCLVLPEEIPNLRKKQEGIDHTRFTGSNLRFYQDVQEKAITLSDEKCFRFIHLEGGHMPYCYDADMNVIESGTYEQALAANLTMVRAYLQKLKDYGVYDNSVIMIISDHGFNSDADPGKEEDIPEQSKKRQHPILFIKGYQERHDTMQVSGAPIMQQDYQEAYARLLDGVTGEDVFDYREGDYRERRYLLHDLWNIEDIVEFTQTGHAGDMSTLLPTGREFHFRQ